jgi:hypothetical protein
MTPELKQALKKYKVDSTHAKALMQTANEILKGYQVTTMIDEYDHPELTAVHLTYLIPCTAKCAVDMYMDFIDLFLSKEQVLPCQFHINFSGTKE